MIKFSIAMSVQQITTVLFAAAFARMVALCVIIAAPGYILNAAILQKNKLLDIKESTMIFITVIIAFHKTYLYAL